MRRMLLRETGAAESGLLTECEAELAEPGPGQVRLRVLACGVCRTDLHIVEGELPAALPRVLGHQVVATIDRLGPQVPDLSVDDRVGVGWLAATCGVCRYCVANRENLCEAAPFTGRDVDGGYAEAMLADARFVYPLPAAYSDSEAAPLLCAGIIGYRALKLSDVPRGGKLGLFGFGASAHLAIQVAQAWGCSSYVFTREPQHQRLAGELGAVWTGSPNRDPGVALDAAVSFAPAGPIVPVALARLARGGTLVINAVHASDIPSFPYEQIYWERAVRSVANCTRDDAREFLALAASVRLRVETETYALHDANDVLVRLKQGKVRGAAVLLP